MKRWFSRIGTGLWIVVAALAAVVGAGLTSAVDALGSVYPEQLATTEAVRASVAAAPRPQHDEQLPTAVVLLSAEGTNAADTLAPYEVLASSGEFNVYTVAPERRPIPLNGGLDLVPDFGFDELAERFPTGVDVVIVPAVQEVRTSASDPLRGWLAQQADQGATVVGVCVGAELLAGAGLLDGREATSHWLALGMGGIESRYPDVEWTRGVRYVDDGEIITTAGMLSGVDGALRVLERYAGEGAARQAADTVGWELYETGRAAEVPVSRPRPPDVVALLNLAYRQPADLGVVLTEGVGEIELASVFRPYTELSYLARPLTVTADGQPIQSRHGLTFVPRGSLSESAGDVDRLVVPGAAASAAADPEIARVAERAGVEVTYLHTRAEFPFDAALRDVASTTDVATATWVAKTLEYPMPAQVDGDAWPWALSLRALAFALLGAAIAAGVAVLFARRPPVRRFVGHYLVMVVAMLAGMMLLGPVWTAVIPGLADAPVAHTLTMAVDMAVGMGLVMRLQGHGWRLTLEMAAAMIAPFVVLLVPYALGALSADGLMMWGHVLMFVTMLVAMLLRREHYTHAHRWRLPFRTLSSSSPAAPAP
ncbi:MAG TPA: DJ-1/PfpI family protein [Jiangellaceae bacterium]